MAARAPQWSSILMFRTYRMLDNLSSKPLVWSSWMHLHFMLHILCLVLLDRCGTQVVEPAAGPISPRFRSRRQVDNNPGIWCGMLPCHHSWCVGYDVANVDRIWDYARVHCFSCLHGCDTPHNSRFQLEIDAGFNCHPVSLVRST